MTAMKKMKTPLVAVQSFVAATRDSGYKSTGSAIAELIDNAFEAHADTVEVTLRQAKVESEESTIQIAVRDNGAGMTPQVLQLALQFGGSTRFGSREASGRYGMGLPNGGLSQACRLEVFSWTRPSQIWMTYLDVEEILSGRMWSVPTPRLVAPSRLEARTPSGTIVLLKKCDRLNGGAVAALEEELEGELGRTFRKFLYVGRRICLNGRAIRPIDPLFLRPGLNMTGAKLWGPPIKYQIRVPKSVHWHLPTSLVTVTFSELPVGSWHSFSNEQKNEFGIAKNAGVSIVRAGREIDYGWYFMGTKRKENYDDWWRCEVNFRPELDELFGVTHSKQRIKPTEVLNAILVPEIERTARELNGRIRKLHGQLRSNENRRAPVSRFEAKDYLLEPPGKRNKKAKSVVAAPTLMRTRQMGVHGLKFTVSHEPVENGELYLASLRGGNLSVVLNELHPFYYRVYSRFERRRNQDDREALQFLLLLLVAGARAEQMLGRKIEREIMARFRKIWGDTIASFLS
jgi:Histidine kinase-, DNA gyrase B-, and HSP90-like ATPase